MVLAIMPVSGARCHSEGSPGYIMGELVEPANQGVEMRF